MPSWKGEHEVARARCEDEILVLQHPRTFSIRDAELWRGEIGAVRPGAEAAPSAGSWEHLHAGLQALHQKLIRTKNPFTDGRGIIQDRRKASAVEVWCVEAHGLKGLW